MTSPPLLILASQSPARAALLRAAAIPFEARPARIDEAAVKAAAQAEGATPDDTALLLAALKAERIRAPGHLVIGADQLLVCNDQWFDKPESTEAARRQLLLLRGQSHTLVTATVCYRDGNEIWRHLTRPTLKMRPFSDAFLETYLELEAPHLPHTVGAYRLEGPGIQLFESVTGDSTAIQGLPLIPLLAFLRQTHHLPS